MQSDFVGHLISEIASDMRGMLARQRCFMLLSMLAPSNLGQMSNRSNPIFEHQLCVCVVYVLRQTHFRQPIHAPCQISMGFPPYIPLQNSSSHFTDRGMAWPFPTTRCPISSSKVCGRWEGEGRWRKQLRERYSRKGSQ